VADAWAHAIPAETENKNKDDEKQNHEELRSERFALISFEGLNGWMPKRGRDGLILGRLLGVDDPSGGGEFEFDGSRAGELRKRTPRG
jgi:hypothetical protein